MVVTVPDDVEEREEPPDAVCVPVPVCDGVTEGLTEGVALPVGVLLPVLVLERVPLNEPVVENVAEVVPLCVAEPDGVRVKVGVAVSEGETDDVMDTELPLLAVCVPVPVTDGVPLLLPEKLGVGLPVDVKVPVGVRVCVRVLVCEREEV